MRAFLAASAVWLLVSSSAAGREIFVNNQAGDDRRAGTVADSQGGLGPCRTIGKALRIAGPGDRIIVANTGEPYRESITLQGARHSGSDAFPFTIVGNGAVLDGTVSLAAASWEYAGNDTFRTRPPYLSFQQLFIDNLPAPRKQPRPGEFPALAPREWCLFEGWLYFRVEPGRLPQSYDLACCGAQAGITLYDVHDVVVMDLAVRGFWLDGVNCHDNVRRSDLVRIAASENGRSGLSIGGASRVRVDTCTAAGNGAAQFRMEGFCRVQLLDNTFDAATAPAIVREGGTVVEEDGESE
jgi:hypothetical protein